MAIVDKRRTDQRWNLLENPYWIVSDEINDTDDDDDTVLFSFPNAGEDYLIHACAVNVSVVFDSTPVIVIGTGTMVSDAIGTVSDVVVDHYIKSATAGLTVLGWKMPKNAENVITLSNNVIVGAAATVPVIFASLTATGAITAGAAMRFHMLISRLR
ncbi:MAG TPA: hypothetical protein ENI76_11025 [Ignavibacteria bacterium]|nr:hypothetical protein [Ignavibacteria bacterium]